MDLLGDVLGYGLAAVLEGSAVKESFICIGTSGATNRTGTAGTYCASDVLSIRVYDFLVVTMVSMESVPSIP